MNRPEISYGSGDWKLIEDWLKDQLKTEYQRLANTKAPIDELRMIQGRASVLSQMLEFPNMPAAGKPLDKGAI